MMYDNDYTETIRISRYAKWNSEMGRRETWDETISRLCDFYKESCMKFEYVVDDAIMKEIYDMIYNKDVMPSMRALASAGDALREENIAGYNCAYCAINEPNIFSSILYILMCGTGVGFSVERQYIAKLPIIPENMANPSMIKPRDLQENIQMALQERSERDGITIEQARDYTYIIDNIIVVGDSRLGWATAFKLLIKSLYDGWAMYWDMSLVRPKGLPLKKFGGRSSGPEPLKSLFAMTTNLFVNISNDRERIDKRLSSIECHDLCCYIAQIVVVGGVRRSALLSLSNPSDMRMKNAKTGFWYKLEPQRAMANNSVCYTEKPNMEIFMEEWLALLLSRSGERGIFYREACRNAVIRTGRRDPNYDFGCNPCLTADTIIKTSLGELPIGDLIGKSFDVIINGKPHSILSDGFFVNGMKPVYTITTLTGRTIKATSEHKFMNNSMEWQMTKSLNHGDILMLDNGNSEMVVSVILSNIEPVYDVVVKEEHCFIANGFLTHNCSEVILRPNEFCNLTECVIRAHDTEETLLKKIEIATIMGTIQATWTDFKFISPEWKKNCEEEALLGVSLTGIFDNPMTYVIGDELNLLLTKLKHKAIETNLIWSRRLGINQSASITLVKPSGTVSQLCNCASGIHPRWSKYYIRSIRSSITDPITQFLIDSGIPHEQDLMNENSMVFMFPIKSPDGAMTRNELDVEYHLNLWYIYQMYYCEHKPSVTINIKPNEWLKVGAWVHDKFNNISGIAFMPYDMGTYKQAPYQEITEGEYLEFVKLMPKKIEWNDLSKYETEGNVRIERVWACVAGGCEC